MQALETTIDKLLSNFTDYERRLIREPDDVNERERVFRRYWSMKEAFVKARGDGLAFALERVEFKPQAGLPEEATFFDVHVDREHNPRWSAQLHALGSSFSRENHWVSVTRGECSDDSFFFVSTFWYVLCPDALRRQFAFPDLCLGPPEDIIDAYGEFKESLRWADIPTEDLLPHLSALRPPFELLNVGDLVPDYLKGYYANHGGDIF